MHDGTQNLNAGTAQFCDNCDHAYREMQRIQVNELQGLCPLCMEKVWNGEKLTDINEYQDHFE